MRLANFCLNPFHTKLTERETISFFVLANRSILKVTQQGHPMDLLLKISFLQANFCWLGDLGEIICPWKEVLLGKSQFRVSEGMSRIASSSICLPGSEEQINFSQQSPKTLKMASKSFIHALLLFSGLFLKISRWVPLTQQC